MQQTVDDFFRKYNLDEFYEKQKSQTSHPVIPFRRERHKHLSYGIMPGFRRYDLFYERYNSAVQIIQESGILRDGIRILDIGSGEAFFKFFFDGMTDTKIEWNGLEVWKERAMFCRHVGYTMHDINLDEQTLPFPDHSFDIVLASHVIEHLKAPADVVRDMARVVKPGGLLLIATPTKPPLIAPIVKWVRDLQHKDTGETQQAFSSCSLRRFVLKSLGWKKKDIIDMRGFRIISSRKKLPLENWKWFYNLSVLMGRYLMLLVPEVNIILKKP